MWKNQKVLPSDSVFRLNEHGYSTLSTRLNEHEIFPGPSRKVVRRRGDSLTINGFRSGMVTQLPKQIFEYCLIRLSRFAHLDLATNGGIDEGSSESGEAAGGSWRKNSCDRSADQSQLKFMHQPDQAQLLVLGSELISSSRSLFLA